MGSQRGFVGFCSWADALNVANSMRMAMLRMGRHSFDRGTRQQNGHGLSDAANVDQSSRKRALLIQYPPHGTEQIVARIGLLQKRQSAVQHEVGMDRVLTVATGKERFEVGIDLQHRLVG